MTIKMENRTRDESELHLEAMLYVLEDPSLDRAAFEDRLADDPRLGEILAGAVSIYQSLRSIDADSRSVVCLAKSPCEASSGHFTERSSGASSLRPTWMALSGLAASLLLIGYLGINVFRSNDSSKIEKVVVGGSDISGRETLQASSEMALWNNVVWAWGELRTGPREHHLTQHVSFVDSETALTACESFSDSDVPEWLVLATAAILEQGSGVDSPLEEVDTRTLIQ